MDPVLPENAAQLAARVKEQDARIAALERQIGRLSQTLYRHGMLDNSIDPVPAPGPSPAPVAAPVVSQESPAAAGEVDEYVPVLAPPPADVRPPTVAQRAAATQVAKEEDPVDFDEIFGEEKSAEHAPAAQTPPPPPIPVLPAPPPRTPPPPQQVPLTAQLLTAAGARQAQRPAPPVTLQRGDFTSGVEQANRPSPPLTHPAPPKEKGPGFEVILATRVLPVVGGGLLILGGAFAATVIGVMMPPSGRIALGYLLAFALCLGGKFVTRRSEGVGRLTIAIGLAFGYFVSYAAHFIPPTRCLPAIPSLVLMIGFVAAIVGLAERWRSEWTAMFAFGLGMLAALISANDAGGFGVVSLVLLSIGAGALLIRNEWQKLTIITLTGNYLCFLLLWVLQRVPESPAAVTSNLAAIFLVHMVFTAAFWRWNRPWIARERLASEVAGHEAVPEVRIGLIPYSTGYAILNSLGLAGLAVFLLWSTKVYWPQVHYLLFALAGLEGFRLAIPALRRGDLYAFHALGALSLTTAGVVAAFGGMTESTMLAAEALILCVAASRADMLRILRPLSAVCGFLAIAGFRALGATPTEMIFAMIPGALLLLSTLPWDAIWTRKESMPTEGFFFHAERFSGNLRGLIAIGTLISVAHHFNAIADASMSLWVMSLVMAIGAIALRARAWTLPGMILTLAALVSVGSTVEKGQLFTIVVWMGAMGFLWREIVRRTQSKFGRLTLVMFSALFGMVGFGLTATWVDDYAPHASLAALALGVAPLLGALAANRVGAFPALVRDLVSMRDPDDEEAHLRDERPLSARILFNPLLAYAVGAGGMGVIACIQYDAKLSLLSPALITGTLAAVWYMISRMEHRSPVAEGMVALSLMGVLTASLAQFTDYAQGSVLVALVATCIMVFSAVQRRSVATALVSLGWLAIISCLPFIFAKLTTPTGGQTAVAILSLGIMACTAHVVPRARRMLSMPQDGTAFGATMCATIGFASVASMLWFLANGTLIPSAWVTVSWGLFGTALLAGGMMIPDAQMRYSALCIFGISVVRVFIRDIADANVWMKVIAAMGIGLLLVLAGIGYGVFRKRLMEKSTDEQPPQPTEPPSVY